jgi:hypothetical protein
VIEKTGTPGAMFRVSVDPDEQRGAVGDGREPIPLPHQGE